MIPIDLSQSVLFSLLLSGVLSLIIIHCARHLQLLVKCQRETQSWYMQNLPASARKRSLPVCRHCGCTQVAMHPLKHRLNYRAHACVRCHQTLYYSPASVREES